ncbi:MAG: putative serine/threonine-protein kinase pkwA [Deltaproteobacteria bacterium]|nr:putative serine/threonine-protein kinase pkwA [Deltaproteobacteria bacterium]
MEEQPAPAPEPEVFPLHSEWAGRYKCGQGFTGVRLVIDAHSTGEAIATFEFGALPENPGVPSGAYQLRGRLQRTVDGGFEAKLSPDQWLDQPAGYVMVGVTAVTDAERHVLRGTIDSPACSGFEVRRRR